MIINTETDIEIQKSLEDSIRILKSALDDNDKKKYQSCLHKMLDMLSGYAEDSDEEAG